MRVRDPVQVRETRMEKREENKLFSNIGLDILFIEPMLLMKAIECLQAIIVCRFTEEILVTTG